MVKKVLLFLSLLISYQAKAQQQEPYVGYLFAHMTTDDYGTLYYSVSKDALHWENLNNGKPVLGKQYWGHADICQGHDGKYYMVGNDKASSQDSSSISFWVSNDLLDWKKFKNYSPPDIKKLRPNNETRFGAPKLYFDAQTKNYILSWHTANEPRKGNDMNQYWRTMVTYYQTSKDLKTFSETKKLFPWDFATIDVIIRHEGDKYYAFLKDEMMPSSSWPSGKSISVSTAPSLEGPWSYPTQKISPNFREAPTLVKKNDGSGYLLYFERYPGKGYEAATSQFLEGPWFDLYTNSFSVPAPTRHGCIIPITQKQMDALTKKF